MKGVKNILLVFAAIMTGMTGTAMAQGMTDKTVSLNRATRTYQADSTTPTDRITWAFDMEPQLTLGDMQMTGLGVDIATPHYASIMFNPPAAMRTSQVPVPPNLQPVAIPHPINDPAAHEPDFALFRIRF
jgi:hypothetical protein